MSTEAGQRRRPGTVISRHEVLSGFARDGDPLGPGYLPAALMDIGLDGSSPTLTCFADGSLTTSMSTGGATMGIEDAHPEARTLSGQFLAGLSALAPYMPVTADLGYPPVDVVRFSLRTVAEVRSISFTWDQLLAPQNPFAHLFHQGEALIRMAISATAPPAPTDGSPAPAPPDATQLDATQDEAPEPASAYLAPKADIRRLVLTGVDNQGNRADLGAVALTMADLGVPGGCVSVACFTDGLTSVYMSHGVDILGLAGASPEMDSLASTFIDSLLAIAPHMPDTDDFEYPELGVARFYVRTPEGVRGISLPADMLEDPRNAFTQAFVTAKRVFDEATRIKLEVPSFDARVKPAR